MNRHRRVCGSWPMHPIVLAFVIHCTILPATEVPFTRLRTSSHSTGSTFAASRWEGARTWISTPSCPVCSPRISRSSSLPFTSRRRIALSGWSCMWLTNTLNPRAVALLRIILYIRSAVLRTGAGVVVVVILKPLFAKRGRKHRQYDCLLHIPGIFAGRGRRADRQHIQRESAPGFP